MLARRAAGGPIRRETISLLFAWRGHVAAVSRLEHWREEGRTQLHQTLLWSREKGEAPQVPAAFRARCRAVFGAVPTRTSEMEQRVAALLASVPGLEVAMDRRTADEGYWQTTADAVGFGATCVAGERKMGQLAPEGYQFAGPENGNVPALPPGPHLLHRVELLLPAASDHSVDP